MTTRKELDAKDETFVRGIETGLGRPKDIEKALAVISINEILPVLDINIMRNSFSHKEVSDYTYQAYLDYIFIDSPEYELLSKLKR